MYDTPLTVDQILGALEEQPMTIAASVAGLPAAELCSPSADGEWSANDVLAHLRACADVWGGYIRKIVAENHPAYRAVNPRTWIESTDYLELDFPPSFRAFRKQRTELVAILRALPKAAWARSATVSGAGRPRERTVLEYAQWLANHERSHLRQFERLVGDQAPSHVSSAARNPSRSSRKIE